MNNNRTIGRVLSVDNFRVFIKIEEDINGTYKSGINGIYEIARINSYLIIPVGSDRIVALITRVTMKDELELDFTKASISLPTSARYISATMLGTICNQGDNDCFIQGVYSFPSLDNPVWYVTEDDLNQIFDNKYYAKKINYSSDFYLPIGTSPAFQDYQVKICPDQLFVKHAAILGNTGSGKSCTLTSILRNLFRYPFGESKLENAHFVIFDTNGEYKSAFIPDEELDNENEQEIEQINAYYYGGNEKVKVPYWLMNWDDFKALLKPSDGIQAPVLNRAIGLAKNEHEAKCNYFHSRYVIQTLGTIIDFMKTAGEDYWKINNYSDAIEDLKSYNLIIGEESLNDALSMIPFPHQKYDFRKTSELENAINTLASLKDKMEQENLDNQIISEQNIDLPEWFDYQKLCTKFMDSAISQDGSGSNKISEFVSTLRLRMNSFLNDKRIAIPLMLKDETETNRNILPQFLSLLFGEYNKVFAKEDSDNFIKGYNNLSRHNTKTNQITIMDMSQLPYEVLETVTALLGRIILEFVSNFSNRGTHPIVLVLEEAQNYIAEDKDSVAKTVFERIAREGRKYGISLIVSSQRPSELSKTVLSQCNSFIIHRLQNPDDQKYVRGLISSVNADLLDQLPIIPQQHAIITGDCVRTPIQVRIDDVCPTPNSHNPKYVESWLEEDNSIDYKGTCAKWLGREELSAEGK